MKLGATDSIKFKKLKMRLRIPHWQAVGLLEALWMFVSRNAPQGDIGRHSDEDIAASIEWQEDPQELILALIECRWLDRSDDHRLLVHDWADHMPEWLKGNLKRHGKSVAKQDSRQPTEQPAKQATEQAAKQPALDAASSLTLSSHTISHHTAGAPDAVEVIQSIPPDVTHGGTWRDEPDEDFEEFWKSVPKRMLAGKVKVWPLYQQRRIDLAHRHKSSETGAGLLLRERFRAYWASWHGRQGRYSWNVATFLRDQHDTDDPTAWDEPPSETNDDQPRVPPKPPRKTA